VLERIIRSSAAPRKPQGKDRGERAIWFIGDVHGHFQKYRWAVQHMTPPGAQDSRAKGAGLDCSLQVGDLGLFTEEDAALLPEMPQHRFFRGNHDNPALCRQHPNYLADGGYFPDQEMFVLAGGYSIDAEWRLEGRDWWPDEELDDATLQQAIERYTAARPRLVVTHECPTAIKKVIVQSPAKLSETSRTERTLQQMWEAHKPETWIFGHQHRFVKMSMQGTHFVCLNEMIRAPIEQCIYEIPGLAW